MEKYHHKEPFAETHMHNGDFRSVENYDVTRDQRQKRSNRRRIDANIGSDYYHSHNRNQSNAGNNNTYIGDYQQEEREYSDIDIDEVLQRDEFAERLNAVYVPYSRRGRRRSEFSVTDNYYPEYSSKYNRRPNTEYRNTIVTIQPSFRDFERTANYIQTIPAPLNNYSENCVGNLPELCITPECFCDSGSIHDNGPIQDKYVPGLNRINSNSMSTKARHRVFDHYKDNGHGVKIDELYEYTESEISSDHGSFVIKQLPPSHHSRESSLTNVSVTDNISSDIAYNSQSLNVNRHRGRISSTNSSNPSINKGKKYSIDSQKDSGHISDKIPSSPLSYSRNNNSFKNHTSSKFKKKSSIVKITVTHTDTGQESGIEHFSKLSSNKSSSLDISKEKVEDNISTSNISPKQEISSPGLTDNPQNFNDANHNFVQEDCIDDTGSIGSATDIMRRAHSRSSKATTASLDRTGFAQVDNEEAILVGDERLLHDEARRGNIEVVESLIKDGIDVNCRNKTDRTVLHWAAGNGHTALLQMLLENGGQFEAADKFGMTPLLWAAWFGHKSCVVLLLRVGAKPTVRNKNGSTLLHCATHNDHSLVVDLLTEELQEMDKDTVDDAGRTMVHIAARHNRENLLKEFIKLNCNIHAKDKCGDTALHIVARYGWHKLIVPLVSAGVIVDAVNNDGKTSLHIAAECNHIECCKDLLMCSADVNAETEDEICPLHLAVSQGNRSVAHTLIQHHADIDAGNKHNQTPLHYAVTACNLDIVRMLTSCGASVNVQDARSETPLHLAAENGFHDITEELLLAKIKLNIKDQKGKTALQVAARGNYVTIVDMIIKAERHYTWESSPQDPVNSPTSSMSSPPRILSFKPDISPETENLRHILYKFSHKQLKPGEWKRLAFHWSFTDMQLQAIEEQYTGSKSYKEHGHRMLLIWLHGCVHHSINPIKALFEGLVAIQKRELAETMRTKLNTANENKGCVIM